MNEPATPFCLLVVAKAPVPGLAKTRLTPPATPWQAAEIAAAALLDTLDEVLATPGAIPVVALTGALDDAVRRTALRARLTAIEVIEQRGVTFADRLANAHADAGARCPGLPIVQIGMDTPQVTADLLAATAAALTGTDPETGVERDAVLGRAEDGGWWVLGLRDPASAALLREVPMSTPDTFSHTRLALTGHGLRVGTTVELSDVDIMADAIRVAEATPGSRFATAVGMVSAELDAESDIGTDVERGAGPDGSGAGPNVLAARPGPGGGPGPGGDRC